MKATPGTMRAIVRQQFGGIQEVAIPEPTPGHVVIEVNCFRGLGYSSLAGGFYIQDSRCLDRIS
jgi:hypothetical protein